MEGNTKINGKISAHRTFLTKVVLCFFFVCVTTTREDQMHLYNLTLQKPSGIVCAVYGNFSGPKAQEIIVSRGKIIELLRPDDSGRLQVILSVDVFGVVRSLIPFR